MRKRASTDIDKGNESIIQENQDERQILDLEMAQMVKK
jgi:hypothetical protein